MSLIVHLPDELLARLRAEAARRGISVDAVVADFAAQLPAVDSAPKRRLSFVGLGASGRGGRIDLHRERAELAAKRDREVT